LPPLPACLCHLSHRPEPSHRRFRAARNRISRPCREGSAFLPMLSVSARSIPSFAARTSHPPAPRAANVQNGANTEQINPFFSIHYKLPIQQLLSFDTLTNAPGGVPLLLPLPRLVRTQESPQSLSSQAITSQLADTPGWGPVAQASARALSSLQSKSTRDLSFPRRLFFLCEISANSAPAFTPSRSVRYLFLSLRFSRITAHGSPATSLPATNHQPLSINPFRIRTSRKHACNPSGMNTSKTQDLKPFRMNTYKKTGGGGGTG
jgi:hypothetical protein